MLRELIRAKYVGSTERNGLRLDDISAGEQRNYRYWSMLLAELCLHTDRQSNNVGAEIPIQGEYSPTDERNID